MPALKSKYGGEMISVPLDWLTEVIQRGKQAYPEATEESVRGMAARVWPKPKKRKLSDWQKFVKANSKKKVFRYRNGKINLKKLGVAYRKKKRR